MHKFSKKISAFKYFQIYPSQKQNRKILIFFTTIITIKKHKNKLEKKVKNFCNSIITILIYSIKLHIFYQRNYIINYVCRCYTYCIINNFKMIILHVKYKNKHLKKEEKFCFIKSENLFCHKIIELKGQYCVFLYKFFRTIAHDFATCSMVSNNTFKTKKT